MKKILLRILLFLFFWLSFSIPSFSGESFVDIDKSLYPTIRGFYHSSSLEPGTVYLENQNTHTKERVIKLPFRSQPKIYLLIQNTPSYEDIRQRAHREVLLMEIDKARNNTSFFNDIVVFTFGSEIHEIPFPDDKLSTHPLDASHEIGQLDSLLNVLYSREMHSSRDAAILIIGDGSEFPTYSSAFAPLFYFQTHDSPCNSSASFVLKSSGGRFFDTTATQSIALIEKSLLETKQSIHSFQITIPWIHMFSSSHVYIQNSSSQLALEVQPIISIHNFLYWILLLLTIFILLLLFGVLLKFILYLRKSKRMKKQKRKKIEEEKYRNKGLVLHVQEPSLPQRQETITTSVWIGSSKDCQICLHDLSVSYEHCYIQKTKQGFFIVDLQSCLGTKVNGETIQRTKLHKEDNICVGETTIIVKEEL
jgi:predicted membrane protein